MGGLGRAAGRPFLKDAGEPGVQARSPRHLLKHMQPGDIVLMTPQPTAENASALTRAGAGIFGAVSHALQGKYTHSGIYAGDGHVIDIRADTGVRKVPLKDLTRDLSVAIVRPKLDAELRAKAVGKAEGYLANRDKIKYSLPGLAPAVMGSFMRLKDRPKDENNVICSTLVANAYGRHKVVPGQARHAVKPSDFLESSRVDYVGDYDTK